MYKQQQPKTPIGEEVCYDGEDCIVVGYVYYGEAGWYYILLDDYMEEHEAHCGNIDL